MMRANPSLNGENPNGATHRTKMLLLFKERHKVIENYSVYIHTNKINGKKYIGLTSKNPEERWRNGNGYNHSTHFNRAIKKYGWNNFVHEVYASGLTSQEASVLEQRLISEYNTTNDKYGYNLDAGGSRTKHSEETKQKISAAVTGKKRSPETIEKLRKASTGNKNSIGHKQSEESKQKNREAHIGKTHILSEEQKTNIALGHKNRKEVICVETGEVFPSIGIAAKRSNTSQGSISSVLTGRSKTAGGYHWKYKQ